MSDTNKTFAELQCNEFVYEIKKAIGDVYAIKWKFRGLDNFGRPEENYYGLQVIDPNNNLPDEVLMVHKNSFKKTRYKSGKSIYFSNRDEAVAEYKEIIEDLCRAENEELIRLEKQMSLVQSRVSKFTIRLLNIK